jgi:hypothetical protein
MPAAQWYLTFTEASRPRNPLLNPLILLAWAAKKAQNTIYG